MKEHSDGNFISPSKFIENLKNNYRSKLDEPAQISPALLELNGGNEDNCEQILKTIRNEDIAKLLLSEFIAGLPPVFVECLNGGIIAVGELNSPEPNTHVYRLDGPTYAVTFNSGLPKFIYRVTRALSTRISISDGKAASTSEEISFEETCRIVTDIFFWYVETGQALGPSYPISKNQLVIASMLATEAECFFLAHELGHIFSDLVALSKGKSALERQEAWDNEFEADRFALNTLLTARNNKESSVPIDICYAGAEIALSIFSGLEAVGVKFEETHPSANLRLTNLREHFRLSINDEQSFKRITAFSAVLNTVFENIINKIKEPDWEEFLNRAAEEVIRDIDGLLNKCTGGMVPDYFGFIQEARSYFEKISSYRLYERVSKATAEFFNHMAFMQENKENKNSREAWIAFQKYKLFVRMTEELHEPARSLMQEALGFNK